MNTNPVSIDDVLNAARRHGLELDAAGARASDAGLDFFAVFARDHEGREWVVRLPRRDDVVARAAHEARVLAFVKPRLPVAVPDWRIYAPDVIAYPKLAGVPAGEIDPEAKAYVWHIDPKALSRNFIQTTATMLATLHAITPVGFDVPRMSVVRAKLAASMEQVRQAFGVPDVLWRRWQTWLASEDLWPTRATFIHGDFHAGHMLVDTEERLIGVLDWTEGGVGDPAVDLAGFQMVFGESAMQSLLNAYVAAGGYVWPRAMEHIAETLAAYPVSIGMFALASGKDEHIEMAKVALGIYQST